jgi:hypothetical protein
MKLILSVLGSFKLLFAGELLDILVFSLSLHAPHIDMGATSHGYEKEREYTTICAARVCAGFARSYAGAARAATMACNAKFLDTRRDEEAPGDSLTMVKRNP